MMRTASEQSGHRWKRRIAAFVAAILLLAQSLGAAHFHPLPSQQKYATDAVVNADDGLCAVCLFRIHSPTVAAVTPYLTAPVLLERIDFVADRVAALLLLRFALVWQGSARVVLSLPRYEKLNHWCAASGHARRRAREIAATE